MSSNNGVNPLVANIPPTEREAIVEAMRGKADLSNLGSGNPEMPMPQFIIDRIQESLGKGFVKYTDYYGFPALRESLAALLENDWDIKADPEEELFMSCGVQEGLYVAMRTVLQPGDEVLIPSPHYGSYLQNTYAAGATPVIVPLDESADYRPNMERLEAAITPASRALVFCNPNNPLGVTWPKAVLEDLAAFAIKHDLIVLVDEIYREYVFNGEPFSIASLPGMKERTFTFGGFSKSHLMMGLRIGFVIGPAKPMRTIKNLHYCVTMCPSYMGQIAAQAALECPKDQLAPVVEEFRAKQNLMYESIAALPGVNCVKPEGAFYLFPDFSKYEKDAMKFALRLIEEAGVVTLPGTEFGDLGQGHLRLSACAPREEIVTGLERLGTFIEKNQ